MIDCGNTRLKWMNSDGVVGSQGAELVDTLDVDALLAVLLSQSFESCLVSSVNMSGCVESLIERLGRETDVKVISHDDLGDSQFAYKERSRLGLDRCLAVQAVRQLSDSGGLVIDSGSAMTADFIAPDGRHVGGYIFPGYKMLKESLISGTSKIYIERESEMGYKPGVDTESCVLNGVQVLMSQAIKYLEELCGKYGIERIFITGGDAEYISAFVTGGFEIRQNIVFDGMLSLSRNIFGGRG
jgi:type III pantothenate kinase